MWGNWRPSSVLSMQPCVSASHHLVHKAFLISQPYAVAHPQAVDTLCVAHPQAVCTRGGWRLHQKQYSMPASMISLTYRHIAHAALWLDLASETVLLHNPVGSVTCRHRCRGSFHVTMTAIHVGSRHMAFFPYTDCYTLCLGDIWPWSPTSSVVWANKVLYCRLEVLWAEQGGA